MTCETARERLGTLLDGELPAAARCSLESHLAGCGACRAELELLGASATAVARLAEVPVPEALWATIERRLDNEVHYRRGPRSGESLRTRPLAVAAAVALAVGLSAVGLIWKGPSARASTVDYSVLLNTLPHDAQRAFTKFLVLYNAKECSLTNARLHAPDLDFDVPEVLPGGFRLQSLYALRFDEMPGVAATYDREGEFLGVVFHRPVKAKGFGPHRECPCTIGRRSGHMVAVGEWRLVHLTDPTTCHCLLSRLNEETELPDVFAAVAPGSKPSEGNGPSGSSEARSPGELP